jgi:hypothetical protein
VGFQENKAAMREMSATPDKVFILINQTPSNVKEFVGNHPCFRRDRQDGSPELS